MIKIETTDDVILNIVKVKKLKFFKENVATIIEQYLKSRICKNCKHFNSSLAICFKHVEIDGYMYEDFGCNKFERK